MKEKNNMSLVVIKMEVPAKWPRKFELWKIKDETLGTRIYSSRTNSEGRDYSLG